MLLSFVTLHVYFTLSLPFASPRALHVIKQQRMMTQSGREDDLHWLLLALITLLLS